MLKKNFLFDAERIFILISIFICIGMIFAYSLSTYISIESSYPYFFIKQVLFGVFSIIIVWSLSRLDPDIWVHRIGFGLFWGGFILMFAMPFLPENLVRSIGGARRWITLEGFSITPVEFFKIGFIYFLAWSFSSKIQGKLGVVEELKRFLPYAGVFLVVVILILVLQNDLGQVIVLGLSLIIMMLMAGGSFLFFVSILFLSFGSFAIFIGISSYRLTKVKQWWYSIQDFILSFLPDSIASYLKVEDVIYAYQISHSINAIKNGGFFGTGIGNGEFKLGFLNEIHTDFVLAGISEELGFVGIFIISFMFIGLIYVLLRVTNRVDSKIYKLFCFGISLLFTLSFLMNAYGISGITPIKGIALPFLSYGGSSMLASSIGISMVIMISKKINKQDKI